MTEWGRPWVPIVPPGHCELCHRAAERLGKVNVQRRVTIVVPTTDGKTTAKLTPPVYLYVCGRHAGGNGMPIATPNTTTPRGAPPADRLFD
jgi:hypothetical protein